MIYTRVESFRISITSTYILGLNFLGNLKSIIEPLILMYPWFSGKLLAYGCDEHGFKSRTGTFRKFFLPLCSSMTFLAYSAQ